MDAPAIKIEHAFDDPAAVRGLVERNGPYPSMESYLPPTATRGSQDASTTQSTLPWFRGSWAVNGNAVVEGAEAILRNPRFVAAAYQLFDCAEVRPTTVVVNVNAPMPAGAVHIDIPSFRGANRDHYSLQLLQAMGTSGLFEPWRIIEAGAVAWFYDGAGGAYDYWPDGLHAPMQSARGPFDNSALVADNDRMYHRIGWIGAPDQPTPPISPGAQIEHGDDRWTIKDAGHPAASYPDDSVRISVLWKAQILRAGAATDALDADHVVEIFEHDLRARGVAIPDVPEPCSDAAWLALVHSAYYPPVSVA